MQLVTSMVLLLLGGFLLGTFVGSIGETRHLQAIVKHGVFVIDGAAYSVKPIEPK